MPRLSKAAKEIIEQRRFMAGEALEAYDKGQDITAIQDLISDLMHLAVVDTPKRKHEETIDTLIRMARMNFEAEQRGEDVG